MRDFVCLYLIFELHILSSCRSFLFLCIKLVSDGILIGLRSLPNFLTISIYYVSEEKRISYASLIYVTRTLLFYNYFKASTSAGTVLG